MSGKYVLDADGRPRLELDIVTWAHWYEGADRQVARTKVGPIILVSTVFLGIDHAFGGGPPLLWETIVLGMPEDTPMWRYTSLEDAKVGHERAVEEAKVFNKEMQP